PRRAEGVPVDRLGGVRRSHPCRPPGPLGPEPGSFPDVAGKGRLPALRGEGRETHLGTVAKGSSGGPDLLFGKNRRTIGLISIRNAGVPLSSRLHDHENGSPSIDAGNRLLFYPVQPYPA